MIKTAKSGNTTLVFNTNNVTQEGKRQALERAAEIKTQRDIEKMMKNNNTAQKENIMALKKTEFNILGLKVGDIKNE